MIAPVITSSSHSTPIVANNEDPKEEEMTFTISPSDEIGESPCCVGPNTEEVVLDDKKEMEGVVVGTVEDDTTSVAVESSTEEEVVDNKEETECVVVDDDTRPE